MSDRSELLPSDTIRAALNEVIENKRKMKKYKYKEDEKSL